MDQLKQSGQEISGLKSIPIYKRAGKTEKKKENPGHDKNQYLKINSPVTLNDSVIT